MLLRTAILCAAVASTACSPSAEIVDPAAAPIVDAISAAPEIERWSFNYRAVSASPYISCLNGIDQVSGVIDLTAGLVLVEPDRAAPPILVTESTLLVANDLESNSWSEAPRGQEAANPELVEMFGEIAAGYVSTGLRAPDPTMTALAFIGIADRVEVAETRRGLEGQTLALTVNSDQYLEELRTDGGEADVTSDTAPIPTVRITVGGDGRVTALEVRIEGEADQVHGDGYVTTFQYPSRGVQPPAAEAVQQVAFASLTYPRPANSCRFQS